jgi:hypothetical protein
MGALCLTRYSFEKLCYWYRGKEESWCAKNNVGDAQPRLRTVSLIFRIEKVCLLRVKALVNATHFRRCSCVLCVDYFVWEHWHASGPLKFHFDKLRNILSLLLPPYLNYRLGYFSWNCLLHLEFLKKIELLHAFTHHWLSRARTNEN